jgi:hypothetical protein
MQMGNNILILFTFLLAFMLFILHIINLVYFCCLLIPLDIIVTVLHSSQEGRGHTTS